MIDKIIIDADLCIKLGGHMRYAFLYDILPLVADKIYMHTHAHGEADVLRKVAKALWLIAGKK